MHTRSLSTMTFGPLLRGGDNNNTLVYYVELGGGTKA